MHALGKLLRKRKAHVNFIPWNPGPSRVKYTRPSQERVREMQELLEKELIDQNTMYDLEAYKQKFIGVPLSKLGDQDVLLKVNLYKNIKSLSTRQALTNYFQKEKKMGYIHVAELSFKEVKKTPGNVIITDIRTLLEVTYLLLND
jgi:glutaredoxin-related protein